MGAGKSCWQRIRRDNKMKIRIPKYLGLLRYLRLMVLRGNRDNRDHWADHQW